jgi:predicted O-linked N-acetylglucosamine transferase (SPINDLY family)
VAHLADNADALFEQARASCRQGRLSEGIDLIRRVLALDPQQARAHNLLGMALNGLGRREEALAGFDRAIALEPALADAHGNRGDVLIDLGRPSEALESYDRALGIAPASLETWCNRGAALQALQRHQEALECYDQAIVLKDEFPEAHYNRGCLLMALAHYSDAVPSFRRALALRPDYADAHNNLGVASALLSRHADALESYDRALALQPDHAGALLGRGTALIELGRHEEALASFDAALGADPGNALALANRSFVLKALGRWNEALASYARALAANPGDAEVHNNHGALLAELGRHQEALASYQQALSRNPDHVEALVNRSYVLRRLGRYREAMAGLDAAMARDPRHRMAYGTLLHCAMACCDWSRVADLAAELDTRLADDRSVLEPLALLALSDDPAAHLRCAAIYARREVDRPRKTLPPRRTRTADDRIRLAYISADFHRHATAYLAAGLFELHDKTRFETIGVSFGADDRSDMRVRLKRSFDRFHHVVGWSDGEIAGLMRELDVDIAVDLKGYTEDARPGVMAYRAAPVQVNYLGYPGTMAMDVIDYVIADGVVLPFDQQPFYSERIVHLPDSYQANDFRRPMALQSVSRAAAGLPDRGLVFCCFNNSWKVNAPVFDIWMRLLAAVEGSVLWLLRANNDATANLQRAAQARGIDPARLIFAPPLPYAEHLARLGCADLVLDTLPYNAHTTASDALWAGVPVLTCVGRTFASRVAASLLQAVSLPELVTTSLDEYEALARRLAADPSLLGSLRSKLERNRSSMALFDTDRFRRHLETAYTTMWDIHRRGERPRSFSVDPLPA